MPLVDHWREEKRSAHLYRVLAEIEKAPQLRVMFTELAAAAEAQAQIWAEKIRNEGGALPQFRPCWRTRTTSAAVRMLGPRRMRPALAALKVRGLSAYSGAPLTPGHEMPKTLADFGHRHHTVSSGGTLRAAVFGMSDGLVSNASLILGVAGSMAEPRTVLLSGAAGLLAGAFSMAAGEWVSVRSQRELFEHQIGLERDELAEYPEQEAEELALIYKARGLSIDEARKLAHKLMSDPERALDTLAREELGLNPDDLGSPWSAALSSLFSFAVGATIPLAAFWLARGPNAVMSVAIVSAVALFLVGCALSLFTGRNVLFSGARMLAIGAVAGAATWLIGRWLGVEVS